ncbi:hypothetical protein [Streptomyces sp. CS227]|uniref:hypothetical protein n=1 Tax=Streptomyces sp. CS227 TaxID=1982763 RepID=UPI0011807FE6|nr:hypothetical protein [Streptomyces sp. CS227]
MRPRIPGVPDAPRLHRPGTRPRPGPAVLLGLVVLCVEGYDLFILGVVGPSLLARPDWEVTKSTLGLWAA